MLQNVFQPDRVWNGAGPGRGPVRDLPELQFPGAMWQPVGVYTGDRPAAPAPTQPAHITHDEAKKLAAAVIAQTLRDVKRATTKTADRDYARAWLLSGEAAEWLALLGTRIKQEDLMNYVNASLDTWPQDNLKGN